MQSNLSKSGIVDGLSIVEANQGEKLRVYEVRLFVETAAVVTVSIYNKYTNTSVKLYELTLDGGDSSIDDTEYFLQPEDYIFASSTEADTTYYVSAENVSHIARRQ
jgi:hypothetical protein